MSEIVQIIGKLGVDATEVYTEIDKVKAKYGEVTTAANKQSEELTKLTVLEQNLLAARAKSQNPTVVAQYNTKITETQAAIKAVNLELEKQSSGLKNVNTEATNVGAGLKKAFDSTLMRNANGEILATRSNYIKLRTELANNLGTDRAEQLAVEMGKVKHELDLASESARAFGSENKFKESGVLLEEIGASLLKLDFRGAQSQAKLLSELTSKITFKDVILAVKQVGSTLYNVGQALLRNPLFLIGAVIFAAWETTKSFIESFEKLGKVSEAVTNNLKETGDAIAELGLKEEEYLNRVKVANDKLSKEDADRLNAIAKNKEERKKLEAKFNEDVKKLQDEISKEFDEKFEVDENRRASAYYKGNFDNYQARKKFNNQVQILETEHRAHLIAIDAATVAERLAVQAEGSKKEIDLLKSLRKEVADLTAKNRLNAIDDTTAAGARAKSAERIQIIKDEIARETAERLKGVTNLSTIFQINYLEKQKENQLLLALTVEQANKEKAILRQLKKDVEQLNSKNSIELIDDKTLEGVQKRAAIAEEVIKKQIKDETELHLLGVTNTKVANDIQLAEQRKQAALIVALNKETKDKIFAIKKQSIDEDKSLAELAIDNADLSRVNPASDQSAKIELTVKYYEALIALKRQYGEDTKLLEAQQKNALLKIDKESKDADYARLNNELSETQRHEQAMLAAKLGKRKEAESILTANEISYEEARLQNLEIFYGKESDAYIKQLHIVEELKAKHKEKLAQLDKDELIRVVEQVKQIVDATIGGINKILEAEAKRTDTEIGLQQKRVDALTANQLDYHNNIYTIAEQGNAKLLELEKKRLDDLTKQREKYVRQQQALAVIELVANTAVAVSKAAAEGGAGAAITIAAALIALIAGLASARSIAGQAAFFKGGESADGYTGDGNIYHESRELGAKNYTYHKKEFIFNNEKTSKYIDIFRKVHKGEVDLNRMAFESDMYKTLRMNNIDTSRDLVMQQVPQQNVDIQSLKAKMQDVVSAIENKPGMEVHINEKGIFIITNKYYKNQQRIDNLTR